MVSIFDVGLIYFLFVLLPEGHSLKVSCEKNCKPEYGLHNCTFSYGKLTCQTFCGDGITTIDEQCDQPSSLKCTSECRAAKNYFCKLKKDGKTSECSRLCNSSLCSNNNPFGYCQNSRIAQQCRTNYTIIILVILTSCSSMLLIFCMIYSFILRKRNPQSCPNSSAEEDTKQEKKKECNKQNKKDEKKQGSKQYQKLNKKKYNKLIYIPIMRMKQDKRGETDRKINKKDVKCSICLDFGSDVKLRCHHQFHKKCIDYWVQRQALRYKNCPNCQVEQNIYPQL